MQIVIDIPEKVNNRLRSFLGHGYCIRDEDVKIIADAIYNGQTEYEAFEWCTNCKEYDSEKHCCHRWTKVIRKTVEEIKAHNPEIIHCGDCRYKDDGIDEEGIPFLKCLNGRSYGGTRINDFCSWAERRTDE